MRIKNFAPTYSSYEQVVDADTIAKVAEASVPLSTKSSKSLKTPTVVESSAIELTPNRVDALTWRTTALIAVFIAFTILIYLTWSEYVKPA